MDVPTQELAREGCTSTRAAVALAARSGVAPGPNRVSARRGRDRKESMRGIRLLTCALLALSLSGCLMPGAGTPVYVDAWAGKFWSGKGVLLEVSDDQERCRVAVRDRALVVRKLWVKCTSLHPRRTA